MTHDPIPNINQPGHIYGPHGLVQTHFHEENNSEWANGIIFTSKEEFNEADEMMLVLIRRAANKIHW